MARAAPKLSRQASRVDGASFRVLERSEFIALSVVQDYLEYLLQAAIVSEAKKNLGVHQSILGDIRESVEGGALTDADRQQAEERLYAAQVARDRGDRGARGGEDPLLQDGRQAAHQSQAARFGRQGAAALAR